MANCSESNESKDSDGSRDRPIRLGVFASLAGIAALLLWDCVLSGMQGHGIFVAPSPAGWAALGLLIAFALLSATLVVLRIGDSWRRQAMAAPDPMYALSLDVLAVVKLDGKVERVNPATTTISGWLPEEVVGRSYLEIVHPEDRPRALLELAKVAAGKTVENFEIRMLCKDGSTRWLSWNARAMPGAGRFYAVGRDTTESRATRADLSARTEELTERVRHLDTLYAISLEFGTPNAPLRERLERVTGMIRDGLRSPSDVSVRITAGDEVVASESFLETGAKLESRADCGAKVEAFYREAIPRSGDVEQRFIDAAASRIGDMLERNRAEERLLRSEARFRSMSEASPLGIFMSDPAGDCIYTNARCRNLWGLGFQRSIGRNWLQAIDGRSRDEARRAWDTAIADGGSFARVCRFVRAEGSAVWASVKAQPIHEDGAVIGYMGVVEDITQRRDAEAGALEWKNRTEAMIRASGSILYDYDPETKRTTYSGSMEEILGFANGELEGGNDEWAQLVHPEDRQRFVEAVEKAEIERAPINLEYRVRRKNGSYATVREDGYPIPVVEGEGVRWIGLIVDISEQRALEHQLRHSQKMEAFGKLAGGVAHDFNNILTVISGFNEMLLEDCEPDDPRREFAMEVGRAADRASELTRQLLAFSRRQKMEPRLVEINEVISGVDRMLRRLIGENVELRTVECEGLHRVKADPGQIGQVLINLAVNARDAMPHGGTLVIETDRVELPEAGGGHVVIKVRDSGVGMPEEVLAQIFEPFFTTKPTGQGTGLGLATCYGIVKQSGGFIEVKSRVGEGTEFRVHLPEVEAETDDADAAGPADCDLPGGSEHILVVEDEPAVRLLAVSVLRRCGYRVTEATDGAHAIECLGGVPDGEMDLVITDVVMPHMGGRDLAFWVASSHPTAKILFTSGYPDQELDGKDPTGTFAGFMPKPYRAETLARTVRRALDGRGLGVSSGNGVLLSN